MQPTVRFRSILNPILITALIGLDLSPALAAVPKETPSTPLTRTFKSPVSQTVNLSKNIYRQEPYEATYEESVPYSAEETYYESVPYEVDEAYEETEYYYDRENVCRDVPYEDRSCRQEQECTQPRKEQRCKTERVCGPGGHGAFQLLKLLIPSAEARRDGRGGGGDNGGADDNGDRDRQERERREGEERQRREGEERQRREGEERQRRESEERQRREGEERQRRESEERQRRDNEERQRRDHEERERRNNEERERRNNEEREKQRREGEERQRREREEKDRRDRDEKDRRDREERDRRDREERERNRCRDVQKCEEVVVDPGSCRQVEKCHNKTKYRRECNWEQVQKSRTVTKYRRVTKYRDEARTRTVTRYRNETRCCVTKYRDVFDRQFTTSVTLKFPAEAILTAREIEKFKISLDGDESNPQVKVVSVDTVYAYEPVVDEIEAGKIVVVMKLKPKYSAKELGAGTLESVTLIDDAGVNFLVVKDKGSRNKLVTQYTAQIADAKTGNVLGNTQWKIDGEKKFHEIALATKLKVGTSVKITVNVQRAGVIVDKPVDFTAPVAAVKVEKAVAYETKSFMDANQVGKLVINGKLAAAVLSFVDSTKNNAEVSSQYEIRLKDAAGNDLGGALIARKDIKLGADGRYNVAIADELGLSEDSLAKLATGAKITVEMKVLRHGRKFKPNPFTFEKKLVVTIK